MIPHADKLSTALVAPPKTIHLSQPSIVRRRFTLSRMARIYIVGIIAMTLAYFGYGLGALIILGFWAIVGSATRRYETSDQVYSIRLGNRIVQLRGDEAFDRWHQH
jgi:hypothetical protein